MNDERPTMNDLSKNASEKITTLHNDFGIDLTQEGEGDLAVMCNLGEGLYEDGLMKGKEEGRKEGKLELALELVKDGIALEKVAKYSKLSLSMIEKLAKQTKLI
ncbi:transposase [Megasphaera elsdenii]|uniref:transposase n=1 Tax=Megasphaera elsdenii TaxID=907 RepID=UPI0039F51252